MAELTTRRPCAGHSSANDLARRPSQLSLHSDGSIDLDNGGGPPSASADLLRRSQDLRSSQNSLPSVDVEREVGSHLPRPLRAGWVLRGLHLWSQLSAPTCAAKLPCAHLHCDCQQRALRQDRGLCCRETCPCRGTHASWRRRWRSCRRCCSARCGAARACRRRTRRLPSLRAPPGASRRRPPGRESKA